MVQESNHQREQELYAHSMNSKEKEDLIENERTMIASKLAELSEEQSKKMLQKEIRLREDAQAKFVLLEKVRNILFCVIFMGRKQLLQFEILKEKVKNYLYWIFVKPVNATKISLNIGIKQYVC